MRAIGDKQKGTIKPNFDRAISIDFQGARITSDTGFLLVMREIDQRFNILGTAASQIDDPRSTRHTDHTLLQLLCQRVYQVAAGFELRRMQTVSARFHFEFRTYYAELVSVSKEGMMLVGLGRFAHWFS